MKFKSSGFTLIELLVVMAIIGILTAIALATYASVQKRGRDSKRQADLKVLQSALEQYHSDQQFYPSSWIIPTPLSSNIGVPTPTPGANTPTPAPVYYLPSPPADPSYSTNGYVYEPISSGVSCDNSSSNNSCLNYCLFAHLEDQSANNFASNCNVAPTPSGADPPPDYNYSISAP